MSLKSVFKSLVVVIVSLVLIFTFSLSSTPQKTHAMDRTVKPHQLTQMQIEEVNKKLDELRIEANKKLANHEDHFTLSKKLSFSDLPISIEVDTSPSTNNSLNTISSFEITPYASKSKSYSVTVKNTAGFNFSHKFYGDFVYSSGKVTSWSHHTEMTGWIYSKSHEYHADRIDSSVVELTDEGHFQALKYAPIEYETLIVVGLYGSGDYRILKASLH